MSLDQEDTQQEHISQQSNDEDEPIDIDKVLATQIKLSDDSESYLFSRGPKMSDDIWPIQCHLCRFGHMTTEKKFRSHLKSEKHMSKLAAGPPNADEFLVPFEQSQGERRGVMNPIIIYPGEIIYDVTTAMADRLVKLKPYGWGIRPKRETNDILQKDSINEYHENAPIIGLCYVFKYFKEGLMVYRCVLCEKLLHEDNYYQHLISADHVNFYIDEHFPKIKKTLNELLGLLDQETKSKYIIEIIRNIYHKLEEWKGKVNMNIVDGRLFESQYSVILTKIKKSIHYDENIVKFSDDELNAFILKLRNNEELLPAAPESLEGQKSSEEVQKEKEENIRKRKPEVVDGLLMAKRDKKTVDKIKDLGLDDSPNAWKKYRELCQREIFELNRDYARYMDMAESHPDYSVQWNKFWMIRSRALRRDGINPERYNFTTEWNHYWMNYMEQCYHSDIEKYKFELRKKMKLPFRPRTPSPTRSQQTDGENEGDNSGGGGGGGSVSGSGNGNGSGSIPSLLSLTPFDIRNSSFKSQQQSGPSTHPDTSGMGDNNSQGGEIEAAEIQKEPLSVLSVLRLLTALEDQLGSLGPTAIQLLSKAIFYEKETSNSANELLNEQDYFMLFSTSLEKLKAQLSAQIIPEIKVNAVKSAIQDLDQILSLYEEYKKRTGKSTPTATEEKPQLQMQSNESWGGKQEWNKGQQSSWGNAGGQDNWRNTGAQDSWRSPGNNNSGAQDNWRNSGNSAGGPDKWRPPTGSNGNEANRNRASRWGSSNDNDNFNGTIPGTVQPINSGAGFNSPPGLFGNAPSGFGSSSGSFGGSHANSSSGNYTANFQSGGTLNTSFGNYGGNFGSKY